MWMMKNQVLFQSAFQKDADQRGSPKSVRKLSSPTKLRTPSTVVKSERFSVANKGTIMIAV